MTKTVVRLVFSIFMLIVFTMSAYSQWEKTNWQASNNFFSLYTNQDMVFARTWDSLNGGRVFFTDDNGANWAQVSAADSDIDVLSIVMWNDSIIAGTWNGLYRCTSDNLYWTVFEPDGIPADTAIWSIAKINDTLFAGTGGHVYKTSVEEPNTWTETGTGIPSNAHITSIVANGNAIFAGSDNNGVFIAANGETSWTAVNSGLTDKHISRLASKDNKLFAVTLKGIFISDSNGENWVSDPNITNWAADNSGLRNINCLLPLNRLIFAGTDSNGVYLSADSGKNWLPLSSGLPDNTRVWSLAAAGNKMFAGTNSGIWRINVAVDDHFTITAEASEGGTISQEGDVTVFAYDSKTFTITPTLGYRISDVVVDGLSAGVVDSYTFKNITDNHTISVSFASAPIYTISASAGDNGSISPTGTVLVSETWSQKFTITPSPGYVVSSVIVDGNSVGDVSAYTFTNIIGNHTISASFEIAPYIISASTGNGGSISPSGEVKVLGGSSQTFTITPSAGYEIADVLIDGVSVGAASSYTFSHITTNHTIIASFSSLIKYQINCGGGASAPYTADQYYNDGSTYSVTSAIDTASVTNSAPQDVYKTERNQNSTYTFPNLISGASYKVRLHFSENNWTKAGIRTFNVTINGSTVLSNFDIIAETGARYKALVKEFSATADASGQIVIEFTTVKFKAKISGIEIIREL